MFAVAVDGEIGVVHVQGKDGDNVCGSRSRLLYNSQRNMETQRQQNLF